MGPYSVIAPKQFLESNLFHRFLMTQVESGGETSSVGKVSSLSFDPYREHQNLSRMRPGFQFEAALVLKSE
jgi:hypothetical protein